MPSNNLSPVVPSNITNNWKLDVETKRLATIAENNRIKAEADAILQSKIDSELNSFITIFDSCISNISILVQNINTKINEINNLILLSNNSTTSTNAYNALTSLKEKNSIIIPYITDLNNKKTLLENSYINIQNFSIYSRFNSLIDAKRVQYNSAITQFNSVSSSKTITDNSIINATKKLQDLKIIEDTTVNEAKLAFERSLTAEELHLKANIASPFFTGVPSAPTAALGTNTNQIANTQFVVNALTNLAGGNVAVDRCLRLDTARTIAMTGDISWSTTFNGSANVTSVGTLANTGVTAGNYNRVSVDSKGRVTSGVLDSLIKWSGSTSGMEILNLGTTIRRPITGDEGAWSKSLYTLESYVGDVCFSFRMSEIDSDANHCMIGFNTDPTTDLGYTSIDYCWYVNNGSMDCYESGTSRGNIGTWNTNSIYSIERIGTTLRYLQDGVVKRTVTGITTSPFYVDSSFHSNIEIRDIKIEQVSFSATTATTLQTARTINGVSFNGSSNITIEDSTKLPLSGGTLTGAIVGVNATADGGNISFIGGNSSSSGKGGDVTITGGSTSSTSASKNGGAIAITAGNNTSTTGGYGASVALEAGAAMSGTGGQARLYSGNSKGTNINGADLMLLAGCGTGTGIGGIMRFYTSGPLTSGAAPQSQTSRLEIDNVGQISAKANIASTSTTTGTLKVTGGIGASGSVYATAFNGPLTGNVTGNADTATTLQTARTIGGVSFNGSANIDLPGVNTSGNQSTTGDLVGNKYISGGAEKPNNSIFGAGKLRYQMLSTSNLGTGVGSWNDVLWISSYTGADVKGSNALIMSKDSDYVGVSRSNYDATTWSVPKRLAYADGTGASGTWGINVTGNADTATKTTNTVTGTNSAELVRGNMGDNDQFRILVGATATNSGYAEIATADDGTEPIHVRQYTGVFTTLTRTATLLDGSGNTSFPGTVTAPTFTGALSGNATSATYATSAGTASTVTNVPAATATTLGGIKISLNGSTLTISTT